MGEQSLSKMNRIATFAVCALALAALATAVEQIDVHQETKVADSFADATEFVQNWMAEGKDETACEKVANTAIKAIEDECKTLQVDIDARAKDNTHCCKSGLAAIDEAKVDHEKSIKIHTECNEELQTVSHEKVDFGKISYAQLDENQCKATFFNSPAFQAQHKKVGDKKKHCTKLEGETAGLKKAIGDATNAACKERATCEKTAEEARDKTFNDAHAACSSQQNKDAFTRAHHMLCVLKGTSLQGCNVPTFQGVKKTAMNKNKCEVDLGGCEHGIDHGKNTYYLEGRCGGEGSSNPKYSFKIATAEGDWGGRGEFHKCEGNGYTRLCDYDSNGYKQDGCIALQGCSTDHWHNAGLPKQIWTDWNQKSDQWKKNYFGKTCAVRKDGGNGAACFYAHGQHGNWATSIGQKDLRVVCAKKLYRL